MKRDVFLSYASKEFKIAQEVCDYLELRGTTCWIAPRNILPGAEYGQSIIEGIENCSVLVLIYSENSNNSQHVLREVERAVAKNVPIIAYKISNSTPCKSMEYFLLSNQWLDATTKGKHLEKLHNSITSIISQDTNKEFIDVLLTDMQPRSIKKKAAPFVIAFACVTVLLIGTVALLIKNIQSNQEANQTLAQEPEQNKLSGLSSQEEVINQQNKDQLLASDQQAPDQQASNQQAPDQQAPDQQASHQQAPDQQASNQQASDQQAPNQQASDQQTSGQQTSDQHDSNNSQLGLQASGKQESQQVQSTQSNHLTTKPESQQQEVQGLSENQETSSSAALDQIEIGNYIKFGSYKPQAYKDENGDCELSWIVVDIDKKNNQVVLLSEKVIDMKPFDVAESGEFDKDTAGNSYDRTIKDRYSMKQMIEFRGNNDWETSNIRTWLNSDSARITYKDQAPTKRATDEWVNAYDLQSGFLYGFSKQEKARICEKKNVTAMNGIEALTQKKKAYDVIPKLITDSYDLTGYASKTTEDKVYLLSFPEVKKYLYDNNLVIFAEPTQSAIDSDKSTYYKVSLSYNIKYSSWALRSPNAALAHQILTVGFGSSAKEDIHVYSSAADGIGIRPAMTISLDLATLEGEGNQDNPYTIK